MKKLTPKEFNALPKKEKAVLVAKDVIAQIKASRYVPNAGNYISDLETLDDNFEGQINESFDKITHCEVCALGAMLMSCTHLGNKLTFSDIGIDSDWSTSSVDDLKSSNVRKLFKSIFTPYQLLMIETAFEGCDVDLESEEDYIDSIDEYDLGRSDRWGRNVEDVELTYKDAKKCDDFYEKYQDHDEDRLIAICKNIIKNQGTFKP